MWNKFILFITLFIFSPLTLAFSQSDLVQQLSKPNSVQGDFLQQRYLSGMPVAISATGEFALLKNTGLVWQMKTPFALSLRINEKGIAQWNGESWVSSQQLGQETQIKIFLGLLSGDLESISQLFTLDLTGEASAWTLVLSPKGLVMKQIFTNIEIKGGDLVQEITLNEVQGDRTLIKFSNLEVDTPINSFVSQALS
ncbi:hypothetical protein CKF54_06330 [Psittacicella hinzii]|uniref:Outer membrane lipoprotein carrier protein LolA n=1 Tax=Psittacicella hinzii TaxID=2028575 RepID=A0A3A1Y2J0_9GAMM|nr:outer membrane lipoprotein carrier protein LolA [Psittacicella hinzii]RIY31651.1 hypothetical protein CKF54_06330 [Psittacicella hinzii]